MESRWWREPFRTVPNLNEWARWNFRPTLPTVTGRRRASRLFARRMRKEAQREALGRFIRETTRRAMTMNVRQTDE